MTTNPSLDDFLAATQNQFRFLEDEFGFAKISNHPSDNPFLVSYLKHPVQISVEGINWGFGVQVILRDLETKDQEKSKIPLWALARLRGSESERVKSDQIQQLVGASNALRDCAGDILDGDTTIFPEIYKLMMDINDQAERPKRKLP